MMVINASAFKPPCCSTAICNTQESRKFTNLHKIEMPITRMVFVLDARNESCPPMAATTSVIVSVMVIT